MKMLKYIDFTNESSNRTSSSLSFYKINEREKDNEGNVLPWSEADLAKFRQLDIDNEESFKSLLKTKFYEAIDELLTKNSKLYSPSNPDAAAIKLGTNFIKTQEKTFTYKQIGDSIKEIWYDKVFTRSDFIGKDEKAFIPRLKGDRYFKEYMVLNGIKNSDEMMYKYMFGPTLDKLLDYDYDREEYIRDGDEDEVIYTIFDGKNLSEKNYWNNRSKVIIDNSGINKDDNYKKIFKLINKVTDKFPKLQWDIQGEFMSLYTYFMLRLYANAIAKGIESINPNKLKEYIPDEEKKSEETNAEQTAEVTSAVKQKVKKRKRVVSPTPTYDRENIRRANKSFGW